MSTKHMMKEGKVEDAKSWGSSWLPEPESMPTSLPLASSEDPELYDIESPCTDNRLLGSLRPDTTSMEPCFSRL